MERSTGTPRRDRDQRRRPVDVPAEQGQQQRAERELAPPQRPWARRRRRAAPATVPDPAILACSTPSVPRPPTCSPPGRRRLPGLAYDGLPSRASPRDDARAEAAPSATTYNSLRGWNVSLLRATATYGAIPEGGPSGAIRRPADAPLAGSRGAGDLARVLGPPALTFQRAPWFLAGSSHLRGGPPRATDMDIYLPVAEMSVNLFWVLGWAG